MARPYEFRNPDGTLRLDEMLGERCVRHYTRILSSSSEEFAAMQLTMAAPAEADTGWYVKPEPQRGRMTPDGWVLAAEGASVRAASSCQELIRPPEIVWDVCGYYRRLGVHWRATRTQIRHAYLAKDPMNKSERLYYAMKQLLDPVVRRAYDLMPLGGLFLGDRDVREMIERAAAMEASRRNAQAFFDDEETDQGAVLKEWGFEKNGVSDAEARDRLAGEPFRRGSASDELGSSISGWEQDWGWYRLSDPYDGDPYHDDPDTWGALADAAGAVLEAWQAMIATALSARGARMIFSVGLWPGNGAKSWHDSKEGCIFFIGRGQITQQMADEAVTGVLARRRIAEKRAG